MHCYKWEQSCVASCIGRYQGCCGGSRFQVPSSSGDTGAISARKMAELLCPETWDEPPAANLEPRAVEVNGLLACRALPCPSEDFT